MNKEDVELLLTEKHEFDCLTNKKRQFLDAYFDEMSIKDACEKAGCGDSYAYKLLKTKLAKEYLKWREVHTDISTTIDKNEIIREWKRIAFANADDALETETDWTERNGEVVETKTSVVRNFAKMSKRDRRNALAALNIKKSRYGKTIEINMKAKTEALKFIGELTDLSKKDDAQTKSERSRETLLDRMKKLSKSSSSKKD